MTFSKPLLMRYKHDCVYCKPLGQTTDYDFYYCERGPTTVIARFGDKGEHYYSGIEMEALPEMLIATLMADKAGYIKS